jgi:hypothetical protein
LPEPAPANRFPWRLIAAGLVLGAIGALLQCLAVRLAREAAAPPWSCGLHLVAPPSGQKASADPDAAGQGLDRLYAALEPEDLAAIRRIAGQGRVAPLLALRVVQATM